MRDGEINHPKQPPVFNGRYQQCKQTPMPKRQSASCPVRVPACPFSTSLPLPSFADDSIPSGLQEDITIVDPFNVWGTWEGWGVSLCWWANVFGQRDDIANLAFSTKTVWLDEYRACLPGLGLNIVRYNAGGSSKNMYQGYKMVSSPNIPRFKQIEGFWIDWNNDDPNSASWNWNADSNQVEMLKKARDCGANEFELFSNSPMWWMLDNHNPSGSDSGKKDNLQSWNFANHSKYLATIAKYAKDNWGLEFTSIEPFNEPGAIWWRGLCGTQEGCHVSCSTQATVVQHLREELDRRGLFNVTVSASDENTYGQARRSWKKFDGPTKEKVRKVNVHGYQYGSGRRDLLYQDVVVADNKRLWNSEYGDSDASGNSMVSNLNLDIKWLHNTAWVYWQLLDSTPGWGLLYFDESTMQVGQPNKKFWVLAQYTRHIRKGMRIIDSGDDDTVTAYDPRKKRLVLVTASKEIGRSITYDLSRFKTTSKSVCGWSTTMTDTANLGANYERMEDVQLNIARKSFTVHLHPNTVWTSQVDCIEVASPIFI